MRIKLLIQLSAAALVLASIIFTGCSEGTTRIYSSPVDDQSQLSTGLEPDISDGVVGTDDGYPKYDDETVNDQGDYDSWIDKYNQEDGGGTGGSTKPQDYEGKEE